MPFANKEDRKAYEARRKPQMREYKRKWKAERRRRWLAEHGPCAKCGSAERLEVDHIDPKQKVDHKVWTWSAVRRNAELAKCQVLCFKCHREKSWEGRRAQHGSGTKYQAGCRCDACRAWKSAECRAYKLRKMNRASA